LIRENILKFAAIDVGSNAVRLLLKRVVDDGQDIIYKKESLIRMPIRLGEDAFKDQRISEDKEKQLINSMKGFKHLIEAYQPISYQAYATSAMREALNGAEIAHRIKRETGIELTIIDGHEEANIIFSNHAEESLDKGGEYLYIDIGGGSTELILYSQGKVISSDSFRIGAVRILEGLDAEHDWVSIKDWVKEKAKPYRQLIAIGSGGNINKIYRFARKKEGKPISYEKIEKIKTYIEKFSLGDRIKILRLRPDRADVIIPAINLYLSVLKWAGVKKMYVPQIGLADGIIHMLYDQFKNGQTKLVKGNE
jgi:exopolyphosphatase / guanosine-5'-triphosphate,3'-diphosphate pyrophosphatase